VNAYLREVTGEEFSAKDFRTWGGTVLAARAFSEVARRSPRTRRQRGVVQAIEQVAARLGNTRAVCRKCYIHPAVVDAYLSGVTIASGPTRGSRAGRGGRLSDEEARVLALLEGRAGPAGRARAAHGRAPGKAA
jgi:DNA topoisomerase-1